MNCVILSGRITKNVKVSESGKTATARLACDRPYPFRQDKDGKEVTDFLTLRFIGEKNANRANQYLHKGIKIDVRGIVCRDSWQKDGSWQEMNYIIVQEWEFAESRAASQQNGGGNAQAQPQPAPANDDFMQIDDNVADDGIPFA